jgi:hypothetical protein
MCNSSLGVWKNTLSIYICFYLSFCSKKIEKIKKKNLCYVFFVKFELNCNCDLHFIGLLKGLNISLCQ